jgi:hypothetical protein
MDILKIEKDILENLDNLEELFNEYEKLYSRLNEIIDIFNWFRKKRVLNKISIELNNLLENIDLLEDLIRGNTWHQFGKNLKESNENIIKMADKLIKIAPKYLKLKGLSKDVDGDWLDLQGRLWEQNQLTNMYNGKLAKDNPEYQLKQILSEIKMRCPNEIYNIFLTPSNLLREMNFD